MTTDDTMNNNDTTIPPDQWAYVAWSWTFPCPVDGAPRAVFLCGSPGITGFCREAGDAGDLWYHNPPKDKVTGVYRWDGHVDVSYIDETDVTPVGRWCLEQEYEPRLT